MAAQLGVEYSARTSSGIGIAFGSLIHFQMGQLSAKVPVINTKSLPKNFDLYKPHIPKDTEPSVLEKSKVSIFYGMVSIGFYVNFSIGK